MNSPVAFFSHHLFFQVVSGLVELASIAFWAAWAMLSARTLAYGVTDGGKLAGFWATAARLCGAELVEFLGASVAFLVVS